jgi:LysR family nitrogen assimilation transcriptional regulator
MEFRQVQYFVSLFEEGSVTRAAKRLGIVQPALSMQIGKLESDVGGQLFERTKQGMLPTPLGQQLYRLFLPVVQDFASAQEKIAQNTGELSGLVKVGLIGSLAQGVLAEAIIQFSAQNPRVNVSIVEGYSSTLAEWVSVGQIEAALINNPRRASTLSIEPIVDEDLVLLKSATNDVTLPERVTLRSLAKLRLVLPTRQHGLRTLIESFAQGENMELVPACETDSIPTIVTLVERTGLMTLLPRVAVRALLEEGRLISHPVVSPRLSRLVVSVTNPRRPLSAATAAFLAVLTEHIRELGGERR